MLLIQQKFASSLIENETWKVADNSTGSSLLDGDTKLICLNRERSEIAERPNDGPESQVTAANLAYVIYTSGSTGVPKGVLMEHRPLVNLLSWQAETLACPAGARTLQFAPLSFDVSFQEIFSTLCSGGTLVMIGEAERRDPKALLTSAERKSGRKNVLAVYRFAAAGGSGAG